MTHAWGRFKGAENGLLIVVEICQLRQHDNETQNLTSYECANRISSVRMILSPESSRLSDIARGRPLARSLGFCPVEKVLSKL